jgi:hypothetical protein
MPLDPTSGQQGFRGSQVRGRRGGALIREGDTARSTSARFLYDSTEMALADGSGLLRPVFGRTLKSDVERPSAVANNFSIPRCGRLLAPGHSRLTGLPASRT